MIFDEISGGDGIPPEPDWSAIYHDDLDRACAALEWGAILREMRSEAVLTPANGHSIRRLTEFKVQYDRAARHVASNGAILKASKAKIGQFNPYWSVMKQASEEIRILEGVMGLTPTTRGRTTKVKREKQSTRGSDKYLKSVS